MSKATNVLGGVLETCNDSPKTGFYRTGCCETGQDDLGLHIICAEMTEEFLIFSKDAGNDLSTPMPQYGFPGLKPGDSWCLCAQRWQQAFEAGVAPSVRLEACHIAALEWVNLSDLRTKAVSKK